MENKLRTHEVDSMMFTSPSEEFSRGDLCVNSNPSLILDNRKLNIIPTIKLSGGTTVKLDLQGDRIAVSSNNGKLDITEDNGVWNIRGTYIKVR